MKYMKYIIACCLCMVLGLVFSASGQDVNKILKAAASVTDEAVEFRRHIHSDPYPRWDEDPTFEYILEKLGPAINPGTSASPLIKSTMVRRLKGGVVIDLIIAGAKKRKLFRADVDALRVVEKTGLSFSSQREGFMHACGHDFHAAMLMGAMLAIYRGQVVPTSNIRFVFQRAEENPGAPPTPISGGRSLVDEGVLDGVDEVFGLHVWNNSVSGEPGVFYSRPGAIMGNSDRLGIKVSASGGHVAQPDHGVNTLWIVHDIMAALKDFPDRKLGPIEPATLQPTSALANREGTDGKMVPGATTSNIMPAMAEVWFGVRTLLRPEARDRYFEAIRAEVEGVVARYPGAKLEGFEKVVGHPATINDPVAYRATMNTLAAAGFQVREHKPVLGGDDFAHYSLNKPGAYVLLGAYEPGSGDHHTPTFSPKESSIPNGISFWLLLTSN